jgi:hypothetical protein
MMSCENSEISSLPTSIEPLSFLRRCVGRPDRKHFSVFSRETASDASLRLLALDAFAQHGGVELDHRFAAFDWRVGPPAMMQPL